VATAESALHATRSVANTATRFTTPLVYLICDVPLLRAGNKTTDACNGKRAANRTPIVLL
jgi:hypothetical protein